MSENKKNESALFELKDAELDKVSGGRGSGFSDMRGKDASGDERLKNPTGPDLQWECENCRNWNFTSYLDAHEQKCRICGKPIDRNTARWST